jgi:hypothetical protein
VVGVEAALAADSTTVPAPSPHFVAPKGKLDDGLVFQAIAVIDKSPLMATIDTWREADSGGPGGRPQTFPTRALLVAMVLCGVTDQPMLATRFRDVLFRQISPTMRHALGVPTPPGPGDHNGWHNAYRNVRTRLHAFLDRMDPSPLPKNRRIDAVAFDALVELRRASRTGEQWAERGDRLTWFINQILEMSISTLPREVRRHWKGSAAVDATPIPAFARAERREKREKKGLTPALIRSSSDPDAGWYSRDKRDAKDGGTDPKVTIWAMEASLVVSGSDDPYNPAAMPTLVLGMAPLHKPGTQVGQNAIRALADIAQRGHPAHLLAGDRAYTQCKPEDFQLPARSLGYQLVLDYKVDQLGLQGAHQGMILVDGSFYCPAMSESLINATKDFRDGKIDEATHRARIAERQRLAIRAKSQPDADGHLRVMCPAGNPAPQVRCQLKPASEGGNGKVRTRIPVTDVLAAHAPKICTQGSITLPPDAGAKFRQIFGHETDEWHGAYATLRNSIEGMNGFIKDGAREAVDDPERRRIRGVAAQSVLVAFQLFSANIRKINEFLTRKASGEKKFRKLRARRKTRSLTTWAPASTTVVTATVDEASADPDPPLTA